jgi:Protein of unknown function (DUF3987)
MDSASIFRVLPVSHGTAGRDTQSPHLCVSPFGAIQPSRLLAYLADALKDGRSNDGFIQSFRLMVYPDVSHRRKYFDRKPNGPAPETAALMYRRIVAMDAEKPLRMQFNDPAQELFQEWLPGLERRIWQEESTIMEAHLAKYRVIASGSWTSTAMATSQRAQSTQQ